MSLLDKVFEPFAPAWMPQLPQRLRLDLPDPLARHAELPAHLFQRSRTAVVEPEAQLEHLPLPRRERIENALQLLFEHREGRRLGWGQRVLVLDEISEVAVLFF